MGSIVHYNYIWASHKMSRYILMEDIIVEFFNSVG